FCGRQSFEAIAEWIHAFEAPFWHRLGYQRRPPTANTFRYLLEAIDPEALEAALWQWAEGLGLSLGSQEVEAISIDGKTLRGAIAEHGRAGMFSPSWIRPPAACCGRRPCTPTRMKPRSL